MSEEIQKLKSDISDLQQRNTDLEAHLAAANAAYVTLVRYLAEGDQLYIPELCNDLDVLCSSQQEEAWQRSLIGLSEVLRATDERMKKDAD